METVNIDNQQTGQLELIEDTSSDEFMQANTKSVKLQSLEEKCIIPVFTKDNESTISHQEFINATQEVANHIFRNERVLKPAVRVSHPQKGRIPEAVGKPVDQLQEHEKTLYYERMAFMIEIPTISDYVGGNSLSLTIGGVRAYNQMNLHSRKAEERFKVFIGFKNWVCINLCISTDGFAADVRVRSVHELLEAIYKLLSNFDAYRASKSLSSLDNYSLSEKQFAQLIGRARMYNHLPSSGRKEIHPLYLGDSQVNTVVKQYYKDKNFGSAATGEIGLWNLFNLFTGANKSSYIDSFLDKNVNALEFSLQIRDALENRSSFWYLS
ncbi:MAG: DUF3871 family protein [Bacteroidales bacterium]|nr:DUF3871 family protein [Bacteroidales bacterium]